VSFCNRYRFTPPHDELAIVLACWFTAISMPFEYGILQHNLHYSLGNKTVNPFVVFKGSCAAMEVGGGSSSWVEILDSNEREFLSFNFCSHHSFPFVCSHPFTFVHIHSHLVHLLFQEPLFPVSSCCMVLLRDTYIVQDRGTSSLVYHPFVSIHAGVLLLSLEYLHIESFTSS
jgi:hypothetical protein